MIFSKEEKLIIQAYKNRKRSGLAESKVEMCLNPQTLVRRHEHKYSNYRGLNSSKNTATYGYSLAEELSFQLLVVDGSITNYGMDALLAKEESVSTQINKFTKACYTMNGSIHEPNFLNIKWGEIDFDCKLKSMDIKYTSFAKDGNARKAELDVVFIEDIAPKAAARMEGKSSPDLTHSITVKEGDTLPLLTERVYGPSNKGLYLEVARVNKLNDFRRLPVGLQLFFPPLDK